MAAQLAAAEDDAAPGPRAARLGVALAGLAQERAVSDAGRRERAVAQSFGFAQEAAANGDLTDVVGRLVVVGAVGGGLPAGWGRTREYWVDRQRSAEPRHGLAVLTADAVRAGKESGGFGE